MEDTAVVRGGTAPLAPPPPLSDGTAQALIKPKYFVKFRTRTRPEPDPKSPARLTTLIYILAISSVARGGAGGAIAPPIGLPTKMQNKENSTFLALLRLSFALD